MTADEIQPENEEGTLLPGSEADVFLVKERYEIKFDLPLPQFDTNGAVAFSVSDKTNPQKELFALICDNNFPPRLSILPYLKAIDHPNLLKLVDFGVVSYPAKKSRNMALIYRKPTGPKVSEFTEEDASLKSSYERLKSLTLSMTAACESLKGYNLTHRSIRLDNIYYKDSLRTEIVLGDCAASFPSLYQPAAYETIENLLCLPQGRGNGRAAEDIYAVGVVLLSLVLQKEINLGLSVPELIRIKLKKGSLAALLNNERIPSQITTLLKGLLNDNEEARWNYLQIYNHLDGKANTFGSSETIDRSIRALTVNNEKFYTAKSAAIAMLTYPDEAFTLIKNGKLLDWVKNGLENEKLNNKIEKIILRDSDNKDYNLSLVSQICLTLDNTLPVKTGDLYVFPEGIPKAIFYYLKTDQNLADFYTLLSSELIKLWYMEQPNLRAPGNISEFKIFVNRKDFGYGIDRIMYDFDDDLPCTSPLVSSDFINTPSRLLKALDSNYASFKDRLPYDKNIIAYLRCKMGKKIDGILTDLNSRQENLQSSAVIRLYANIQNKHGPVQLHNLSQWLLNITKPIIRTYHNLKYQKYLERELIKVAKSGKIIEIYEILENDEARQKDRSEYTSALKEIKYLTGERNRLINGGSKLDEESRELAIRFASVMAILTMITSFIFSLIYWVTQ